MENKSRKQSATREGRIAPVVDSTNEDRYWGLFQKVSRKEYRVADGIGKCVLRLADPLNNNAWHYFVHVPLTLDGKPPHANVTQ